MLRIFIEIYQFLSFTSKLYPLMMAGGGGFNFDFISCLLLIYRCIIHVKEIVKIVQQKEVVTCNTRHAVLLYVSQSHDKEFFVLNTMCLTLNFLTERLKIDQKMYSTNQ